MTRRMRNVNTMRRSCPFARMSNIGNIMADLIEIWYWRGGGGSKLKVVRRI
jgi:hypothetical protein